MNPLEDSLRKENNRLYAIIKTLSSLVGALSKDITALKKENASGNDLFSPPDAIYEKKSEDDKSDEKKFLVGHRVRLKDVRSRDTYIIVSALTEKTDGYMCLRITSENLFVFRSDSIEKA